MDRDGQPGGLLGVGHIDGVAVAVPHQPHGGGGMVETKVAADKPGPMLRQFKRRLPNNAFGQGKDPALAQHRDAKRPGFAFVGEVRADNLFALLG